MPRVRAQRRSPNAAAAVKARAKDPTKNNKLSPDVSNPAFALSPRSPRFPGEHEGYHGQGARSSRKLSVVKDQAKSELEVEIERAERGDGRQTRTSHSGNGRRMSGLSIDSEELSLVQQPGSSLGVCCKRTRKLFGCSLWRDCLNFSIFKAHEEGSSDDEESGVSDTRHADDQYTGRNRKLVRPNLSTNIYNAFIHPPCDLGDMDDYRHQALNNLGVGEDKVEDWTIVLSRWTRTFEFWVSVEVLKIRSREEPPLLPQIYANVSSLRFEIAVATAVITNCCVLGWATYYAKDETPLIISVLDNCFVVLFIGELLMRALAFSWVWFFSITNALDVAVVFLTSILPNWILAPMDVDAGTISRCGALRIFRVVRLVRFVRMLPRFADLWLLVSSIISSSRLLFWSFMVVAFVHLIFAIAVIELVIESPVFEGDEEVDRYYGDLFKTMLTLLQMMTFDGVVEKLDLVVEKSPPAIIVFVLFLGVAGIVLNSLMTAIIMKHHGEQASKDVDALAHHKKLSKRRQKLELKRIFEEMDADKSGTLTKAKFGDIIRNLRFAHKCRVLDIELAELPDIFEILDDGNGLLTAEQFCEGIFNLEGPAMNCHMMKARSGCLRLNQRALAIFEHLQVDANDHLNSLADGLGNSFRNLKECQLMVVDLLAAIDSRGIETVHTGTNVFLENTVVANPIFSEDAIEQEIRNAKNRAELGVEKELPEGVVNVLPKGWASHYMEMRNPKRTTFVPFLENGAEEELEVIQLDDDGAHEQRYLRNAAHIKPGEEWCLQDEELGGLAEERHNMPDRALLPKWTTLHLQNVARRLPLPKWRNAALGPPKEAFPQHVKIQRIPTCLVARAGEGPPQAPEALLGVEATMLPNAVVSDV